MIQFGCCNVVEAKKRGGYGARAGETDSPAQPLTCRNTLTARIAFRGPQSFVMRHRFFTTSALVPGTAIDLTGEEFHHLRIVRIRDGEPVELFDGHGVAVEALVRTIGRDAASLTIERSISSRESHLDLTLAMAIIQLEKFELVLQKATELGVRRIVPLVTERIEVRHERYRGKHERWEKIVFEAVKQCGRASVPSLDQPIELDEAIAADGLRILFDADAQPGQLPAAVEKATLFIGPEGGWSERELQLATERGATFRRIGPRRLRAETAAIVGVSMVASHYGDLG
jgi:16S rRNA (uracil1498-N3)-methyltransferase